MIAFTGFGIIAFWESYHIKGGSHGGYSYAVSDPLDLTVIAVCAAVACFGFLWYNSNPASIFMGDTGSLALGGLFAALSIATHTEFLAVVLGGLYVMEAMSDVIQVGYFKMTHKRVFKMAPIHHHFDRNQGGGAVLDDRTHLRAARPDDFLRRLGYPLRPAVQLAEIWVDYAHPRNSYIRRNNASSG